MGPTGTGKTATALLLAERLEGEIVGCDALQVYRGFDVATAKPSVQDRRRIPYHLVDVVDPWQDFSVADYIREADRIIGEIAHRGRVPLVAGGTGMYLRGLLRGIVPAPARDPALRERLRGMAARHGSSRLHRWLGRVDPDSARRLAPGDRQRVVRALEVALTGHERWSETLRRDGTWQDEAERYPCLKIGLDMDRSTHDRRLEARVDAYFRAGLVEEVRALIAQGVPPEANAFKAIGYREVLASLRRGDDPEKSREEVQANTRRFAKRQRTWFRKEPGVTWLDAAEGPDALAAHIERLWQEGDR